MCPRVKRFSCHRYRKLGSCRADYCVWGGWGHVVHGAHACVSCYGDDPPREFLDVVEDRCQDDDAAAKPQGIVG